MIKDIASNDEFQTEVLERKGVVLVYVWAGWCNPCERVSLHMSSLSNQYGDKLLVAKIDAETEYGSDFVNELKIMGIPTMFLYVDGQQVKKIIGAQTRSALERVIAEYVITQL
jgi:thioredoxin 1